MSKLDMTGNICSCINASVMMRCGLFENGKIDCIVTCYLHMVGHVLGTTSHEN